MSFKNYFFTLTFTILIAVSQAFAGNLYWVGNSGNWNDVSHWANTSGGKGGVGIPTANDNVFVDNKSFSQKDAIITINSDISVNNLSIISEKKFTINSSKNSNINISGSLQVTSKFNNQIKSNIRFKSTKNETIHFGWFVWQTDIYFEGTGTYQLTSPIQNHEYSIYHNSGTLDLNRNDISSSSFISNSNIKRKLISTKSTILTYHKFEVENKKNEYDFSETFLFNLNSKESDNSSTNKVVTIISIITDTSSCGDVCDGRIIVNFTTTCPSARVNWNPGTPQGDDPTESITTGSDTIFNLCPGIEYTAIVTDSCAGGSTRIAKATVLGHASISEFLPAVIDTPTCNGVCDGQIEAFIDFDSKANPSYQWTPGGSGDTLPTLSGLCDGIYSLRALDGFGCDTTFFYTIVEPDSVSANITVTDVACFGTCTGSITSNPTGGTGPGTYNYLWLPTGATTPTINNLCDGSIDTVIVTDANGCTGDTIGMVSTVPQLQITSSQIDVSCGGYCNASASATVNSGGVANYTHNWSTGFSQTLAAGQTSTINLLCAGTYADTIVDANGCDTVLTFVITEPDTLLTTTTFTNVKCFGACDGTAITAPYNGTAPYSYVWTPTPSPFDSVAGLCPGQVIVTVTDTMGCVIQDTITITEPDILLAVPSVVQDMSCPGVCDGIATSDPTGGTPGYSWIWSNTDPTQTTTTGLCQGFVTVTVTDSNLCVAIDSVFINEPIPMVLTMSSTDVTCNGGCNGTASVVVNGGNPGYTYNWSPVPPNGQGTDSIWGLCAVTTYTVTVTDNNGAGCSDSNSVTINEPTPVTATLTTVDLRCNSVCTGSATITLAGGTPPYMVSWDGAPFINVIGASNTINNLCAIPNPHTVDVRDTNGCITPFTFVITEPLALTTTSTSTNLTCTDSCIGTGTTFPLGGTAPYTYNWTNGDLTQTADSLCAGTWLVTVTDDSLCTVMDSVIITQPDTLNPNVQFTNITCNGANNGTAVSLPFGGTTPYTSIIWRRLPGNTVVAGGNPISSLSAGQYYVTVTDTNGCTARDTITITNPPLIVVNPSAIGSSCATNCDGQATVNPTGGTGSLTSWSFLWCVTAETTQTTAPTLCPGTYCITVTDSLGCTKTDSATIAPSIIITILTDTVGISCNGLCDGTATAFPSGGVLPYTYLWDNIGPDTTQTADSLCPGTYTVTVTDSTGCVANASVLMPVDPSVLQVNGAFTNVTCNGASDGTISAAPSGGTPPYVITFSVSPQIGLPPGTYWASVLDANGCRDTDTLVITQPDTISPNATVVNVDCNGNNTGSICLAPTGGTPGYTYLWSGGLGTNPCVNGLIAGSYTVTITDTNGCIKIITYQITQPTVFASNPYIVPETCFGACDGIAGITVSGGTPPHTSSWSVGPTFTTDTIYNLCPGVYSVISIDTNGCSTSENITILGNAQLFANTTGTSIQCNGACTGTATATPSGGAGGYTYLWTSVGGSPIPNPADSTNNNLCPDTYNVTVTDANGCTAPGSYTVSNVAILQVTLDSTNITCNGLNNGTATATPIGGTPPYQFSWVGGNLISPTNTDSIYNLIPGIYTVTVTDTNGCFFSGSVNIQEPSLIVANEIIVDANCGFNDGSIIVVPTGGTGTGTYTHSWSNGSTSDTLTGLGVGFYTDTITDGNGCVQTFTFPISNPDGPKGVTATVIDASCFGACDGAANVIPIGGTPGYTYDWNGVPGDSTITGQCAGTLNLTVADALGCVLNTFVVIGEADSITTNSTFTGTSCNGTCDGTASVTPSGGTAPYTYLWSNGLTTPSVSNLCVGINTVTITDFKGCTKVVTFNITSPNVLTVSTTTTGITCNGANNGTATATPLDGTPNYSYSWTDPLNQITQTAINLPVGTFIVTVTDNNGCSVKDTITINEPSLIVANEITTDATCGANDGTATVAPTGGAGGGYSYNWTTLGGLPIPNPTGLAAGTYPVEITDGNGCKQTFLITINNTGGPTITTNSTNVSCSGVCDGTSTVSVISGSPNYDYLWTGGAITGSTTQTVTGLCEDTYTVQVKDGNNCISVATVTIGANAPITANVSTIDITCNGGTDGSALVVPVGGVPQYSYSWSGPCPAPPNNAVAGLCAGTYTVTITDNAGCSSPITVVINEPNLLTVNATANNLTCFGQSDGSATATPAGGTAGYSFQWSDGFTTTPTISGLTAGVYSVIVTDDNGCTATDSVTIFSGNAITANFSPVTNATCGLCDGSATINVGPGSIPYTYLWSPGGQNTPTINNLCPGAYSVDVTNSLGCTQTFSILISNPNGPTITTSADSTSCYNSCDGLAWTIVNVGNPPYTFQWSDDLLQTNDTATALCAGLYNVIVQDSLGCITVDSIRVDQPAQILANLTTTPISCFGDSNGTATVNPSGGIGTYNVTWSNFDVGLTATNLPAGPHSVTITDDNGCSIVKNFNLLAPTVLNTVMSSTTTTCNGDCDGTALTVVSGGTPPYIYAWNTTPIQNNSLATSLCAGLYTDTVTDNRGCIKIDTISVITPDSLFTTSTPTPAICNGENSGSIFTNPTGGVPNYSYIWNPTSPIQTTQTATNLAAGTYNVIVVDANNCTAYDTVTVNEPITLNDSTIVNGPTCGVCDGSATANPVGGIGPYTFLWCDGQTTQTASNLCAGIICLEITDLGTGCVYDFNVIVNSVTGPTVVLTITGESCPGSCDGEAKAIASNGNPPYSFSWTPPGTLPTLGDSVHELLCSDFYTVTVTDAIGCISTDTFSITSTGLNLSIINVIPESCFNACDGSATVVAGAGLAPFTYQWNPSSNTDSLAINLCVGNYTAVVTDSLNCRDSIVTTITGPTLLTVSIDLITPITCNAACDGVLSATVLGGTPGYTYLWSDGQNTPIATNLCADTIWVRVTDANGCTAFDTLVLTEPTPILANEQLFTPACNVCDGRIELYPSGGVGSYDFLWTAPSAVAGQNTPIIINLCANVYTVEISDFNNCKDTFTFALSNTNAPVPNNTVTQPTCNNICDGSITANPVNGTAPYTYVWSPNAFPPNNLFGPSISDLCPDIYSVNVTDSLGCVGIEIDTIINPVLLLANIDSSNITCNGFNDGWAVVHPSGGSTPYGIAIWTPGGIFDSISNLAPGTYVVNVTDANGCTVTDTVTITEPTLITTTPNITDASCTSVCDGQVTLNASGGAGGYGYSWNPTGQITDPAVNLCFGSYSVTITDQSGCSVVATVGVGAIDTVLAFAGNDTTVCAGSSVVLSGSTLGNVASVEWFQLPGMISLGISDSVVVSSATAQTICYVFEAYGVCNGFDTVCVTYNPQPIANAGIDITIVEGNITQLNATGGGTYLWTPSLGLSDTTIANPIANPITTTTYYVTVTSSDGCISTDSIIVTVIPTIRFPDGITPNSDGKNDTWVIDYLDQYPNHVVEIYNRWGELLYRSTNYQNDWDGTYNGENLPVGTYYFVIELNDGKTKPFTGPLTVLR